MKDCIKEFIWITKVILSCKTPYQIYKCYGLCILFYQKNIIRLPKLHSEIFDLYVMLRITCKKSMDVIKVIN